MPTTTAATPVATRTFDADCPDPSRPDGPVTRASYPAAAWRSNPRIPQGPGMSRGLGLGMGWDQARDSMI